MATYRNQKNGAIIVTELKISSDNWLLVEEKKKTTRKKVEKKKDDE